MKFKSLVNNHISEYPTWFALAVLILCSSFSSGAAGQDQTIGSVASLNPDLRAKVDKLSNLQKFQQGQEYEWSRRDAFSKGS
jgi:hypothetical protein